MATGPAPVALAVLGHETRHLRPWRLAAVRLLDHRTYGFFFTGWAIPWPAALWAAAAVHVAVMLARWAVEVSCDLGALAEAGRTGMTSVFDIMTGLRRADHAQRAAMPLARRVLFHVEWWVLGPVHPPIPVRRVIVAAWSRLSAMWWLGLTAIGFHGTGR